MPVRGVLRAARPAPLGARTDGPGTWKRLSSPGIPASGKSTFCLQRFFKTHLRINLDMLKTRQRERVLIEACIAARQPFVQEAQAGPREGIH